MSWLAAIPAIASGASALSNLFGGGKSSGSQEVSRRPYDDPEFQPFWDEFVNTWSGYPKPDATATPGGGGGTMGDFLNRYKAMETGKRYYSRYGGGGDDTGGVLFPDDYGFGYDPGNLSREDRGRISNAESRIGTKFWANLYQGDPGYAADLFKAMGKYGDIKSHLDYYGYDTSAFASPGGRGGGQPEAMYSDIFKGRGATPEQMQGIQDWVARNSIPGGGGDPFPYPELIPQGGEAWGGGPIGQAVNTPGGGLDVSVYDLQAPAPEDLDLLYDNPRSSYLGSTGLFNPPAAYDPAQGTPGLLEMMQSADVSDRRAAERYLTDMNAYTQGVRGRYFQPLSGSIGGGNINVIPGASMRSGLADLGILGDQAQREFAYESEYNPYKAPMAYLNQLQELAMDQKKIESGIQSSEDRGVYQEPFGSRLMTSAYLSKPLWDYLKNIDFGGGTDDWIY